MLIQLSLCLQGLHCDCHPELNNYASHDLNEAQMMEDLLTVTTFRYDLKLSRAHVHKVQTHTHTQKPYAI